MCVDLQLVGLQQSKCHVRLSNKITVESRTLSKIMKTFTKMRTVATVSRRLSLRVARDKDWRNLTRLLL